jgi:hypothetical protein
MSNIDWTVLPYDHSGRWSKKYDSIMNPRGDKITWPQLVAEFVIYWRTEFLKDYKNIQFGPDWYKTITKQVRQLNQQACSICNYFPHPDDEPLVVVAFKNVFRKNRVMTIGQFRKVRKTKDGKINITQNEKDILTNITYELKRLVDQRDIFKNIPIEITQPTVNKEVTYSKTQFGNVKSPASIIKLEENTNTKPQ